jgi:hypothetical protein
VKHALSCATIALWAVLATATARAETYRLAVVVGNNRGSHAHPSLHYAETDAAKLAQTLTELGDVHPGDLFLLEHESPAVLRAVFTTASERIAGWHRDAGARTVLLFYFSGHSDGTSLELGDETVSFAEVRRWVRATGSDVKVVIVDSCKSGALLGYKGATPGVGFKIRLTDDLNTTGEALLSSSAADELALESREIRGSFFTHHLISGLRGAADSSGDQKVTLTEAYQYAFEHTVAATASTLAGTQHPAYDYELSGQGDVVLAELSRPTAQLELPSGFDRILIVRSDRDQVLAEVPRGAAARIALPDGPYTLRAVAGERLWTARLRLAVNEHRLVRRDELMAGPAVATGYKGDAEIVRARPRLALALELGSAGGVAASVRAGGTARLSLRAARPSGWAVALDVASARGDGFWETSLLAYGGYRLGGARGRWSGFLGLEVGAGLIVQSPDSAALLRSPVVVGAPWLGGAVRLQRRLSLTAELHTPLGWLRKEGHDALAVLPAGWLGVLVDL